MVVAAASRVDGDLLGLLGELGPAPEQPGLKSLPENRPPPGRMATRPNPGRETPREADDEAWSATRLITALQTVARRGRGGDDAHSPAKGAPGGYAWVKRARKLAALLAPLGLGRENGLPLRLGLSSDGQADRVARPSPRRTSVM
jgi:hypothetical protein